jgi:hypothetical protein
MNFFGLKSSTAPTRERRERELPPWVPKKIVDVDPNTGELIPMPITKADIERVIENWENDPRAGRGLLTRREELVHDLLKMFNTSTPTPRRTNDEGPVLSETKRPAPEDRPAGRKLRSVSADAAPTEGQKPLDLTAEIKTPFKAP